MHAILRRPPIGWERISLLKIGSLWEWDLSLQSLSIEGSRVTRLASRDPILLFRPFHLFHISNSAFPLLKTWFYSSWCSFCESESLPTMLKERKVEWEGRVQCWKVSYQLSLVIPSKPHWRPHPLGLSWRERIQPTLQCKPGATHTLLHYRRLENTAHLVQHTLHTTQFILKARPGYFENFKCILALYSQLYVPWIGFIQIQSLKWV